MTNLLKVSEKVRWVGGWKRKKRRKQASQNYDMIVTDSDIKLLFVLNFDECDYRFIRFLMTRLSLLCLVTNVFSIAKSEVPYVLLTPLTPPVYIYSR